MRHAFPNLWTTQLRPPDLAVDNSRPTLTPTTQDGTTGSCSPDRHSQAGGGEGHCGGRGESDRGDTLPEPIRTGDVRKTSGSGTPPYGIRREARQRPGHTVSMGGGATTGTPGKPRVIVKEPVMLDVIWLLGVIALFILLALCVKGVDAL